MPLPQMSEEAIGVIILVSLNTYSRLIKTRKLTMEMRQILSIHDRDTGIGRAWVRRERFRSVKEARI